MRGITRHDGSQASMDLLPSEICASAHPAHRQETEAGIRVPAALTRELPSG